MDSFRTLLPCDPLNDLGLRSYPAQAAARCHRLGEGIQPDDPAIDVNGEEGRRQRIQKREAG